MVDSGASKCFIPRTLVEKLDLSYVPRTHGFVAINKSTFQSLGLVDIFFRLGLSDITAEYKFFVADVPYVIIGSDFLKQAGFAIDLGRDALYTYEGAIVAPFIAIKPPPFEELSPEEQSNIVRVSGDGGVYRLTAKSYPHFRLISNRNPAIFGTHDYRCQGRTIRPCNSSNLVVSESSFVPIPPPMVDGKVIVLKRPQPVEESTLQMPTSSMCPLLASSSTQTSSELEFSTNSASNIGEDHPNFHRTIGDDVYSSQINSLVTTRAEQPLHLSTEQHNVLYVGPSRAAVSSTAPGVPHTGEVTRTIYWYGDHPGDVAAASGVIRVEEKLPSAGSPEVVVTLTEEVSPIEPTLDNTSSILPVEVAKDFEHTPIVTDHDFALELVEVVAADMELCAESEAIQLPIPKEFEQMCVKHQSLFSEELGASPVHNIKHRIVLLQEPRKTRMYSIPLKFQAEVEKKVHEMLHAGILQPSSSAFASPMTIQLKKNGQIRPCIDYRALNEVIVGDVYPLPRIDELVAKIHGSIFTSIDLKDGFHQVPLEPESMPYTAVFTPYGNFEFTRLPFGLKTAPSGFQRFIDIVLHGIKNVIAYIDDILIYTDNEKDHIDTLAQVFIAMEKYGLKINKAKSHFFRGQVTFLGFDFDAQGHRPTEQCLPKLDGLTPPRTRRQLQSFLGVVGYYRAHIPNFAKLADPLYQLLPIKAKFHWDKEQQVAFETIRQLLKERYPLAQPVDGQIFHLYVDASQEGMGAVLLQKAGVVGYYAKRFNPTQRRYAIFEQEALALITAIRHYRYLLLGQQTIVWTDHKPLVSWFKKPMLRDLPLRQAKWLVAVQDVEVDIRYIPGEHNHFADLLSRPDKGVHFERHVDTLNFDFPDSVQVNSNSSSKSQVVLEEPEDVAALQACVADLESAECFLPNADLMEALAKAQADARVSEWKLGANMPIQNFKGVFGVRSGPRFRILVPENLRHKLVQIAHDTAHQGGRLTFQALASRYFWPHMRRDVDQYVSACDGCARAKPDRPRPREPLSFLATDRFKCVHIDIVGPLKVSGRGHNYLVTMLDRSTRWIEAIPTRSITTTAVASIFIKSWIARYGLPEIVISDQGRQFEADLFKAILAYFGIERRRSTAYHPQTNGRLERAHRTLKSILRSLQHRLPDWEQALPLALFAMRTAVSDHGYSPAQLLYIEPLAVPAALVVPVLSYEFQETPHVYLETLQRDLVTIRSMLTQELQETEPKTFPHKMVFLKTLEPGALDARFKGPYRVLKVDYPTVVIDVDGTPTRVNVDRLKPAGSPLPAPHIESDTDSDEEVDEPNEPIPPAIPPLTPQEQGTPQAVTPVVTPRSTPPLLSGPHGPPTPFLDPFGDYPLAPARRAPSSPLFPDDGVSRRASQNITAAPSPQGQLPPPNFAGFDLEPVIELTNYDFDFDAPYRPVDLDNLTPYRQRHQLRQSVQPPMRYINEMPRASVSGAVVGLVPGARPSLMGAPDYLLDYNLMGPSTSREHSEDEVEALHEEVHEPEQLLIDLQEPLEPIVSVASTECVRNLPLLQEILLPPSEFRDAEPTVMVAQLSTERTPVPKRRQAKPPMKENSSNLPSGVFTDFGLQNVQQWILNK